MYLGGLQFVIWWASDRRLVKAVALMQVWIM